MLHVQYVQMAVHFQMCSVCSMVRLGEENRNKAVAFNNNTGPGKRSHLSSLQRCFGPSC